MAIVATVPEAPGAQSIQAFAISAPVVVDASGHSLSQEIAQSLATIGIIRPDQVSSILRMVSAFCPMCQLRWLS